jgi:hypothetical protein
MFMYEYQNSLAAKLGEYIYIYNQQYSKQVRARIHLITSNWTKLNQWNSGAIHMQTAEKKKVYIYIYIYIYIQWRISNKTASETCKKNNSHSETGPLPWLLGGSEPQNT